MGVKSLSIIVAEKAYRFQLLVQLLIHEDIVPMHLELHRNQGWSDAVMRIALWVQALLVELTKKT
jgi:hypothetical protein